MSANGADPAPVTRALGNVEVPAIELSAVNLTVGRAPLDASKHAFIIGPVFLYVSFDDDAKAQLVKALTGIEIVSAADAPQL